MKPRGLDDSINFGRKHRGRKIENVIEEDPRYVEWSVENIDFFELDADAEALLIDTLEDL